MTKQQRLPALLALFLIPGFFAVLFGVYVPDDYSSNKILVVLHEVVIPLGLTLGPMFLPLVVLKWWNTKRFLRWIEEIARFKYITTWLFFLANVFTAVYVVWRYHAAEKELLDLPLMLSATTGIFLSIFNLFLTILSTLPFAVSYASFMLYAGFLWIAFIQVLIDALRSILL